MASKRKVGLATSALAAALGGGFAAGRLGGEPMKHAIPAREYQLPMEAQISSALYRTASGDAFEATRSPGDPAFCWQLTVRNRSAQVPSVDERCADLDAAAAYAEEASGFPGARATRIAAVRLEQGDGTIWGFQLGAILEADGTWRPQ